MKNALLLPSLLLCASIGFAQGKKTERYHHPGQGGGVNAYYGDHYSPPYVMSQADYERACDAIRRQSFDDDRLIMAQNMVQSGMNSSDQVRGILRHFSFESTRLEFAKFAYAFVVDPFNYYVVNDGFCFSSSKDELAEYMSTVQLSGQVVEVHQGYGVNAGACGGNVTSYSTGTMTVTGGVSGGASCGTGGNVGVNGYYGAPAPVIVAIHNSDFERIICTVRNQTFERDKMIVAKQALTGRWLTSAMVVRLARVFTFDSDRLEIAKFAYGQTVDAHNYYMVHDAFTFSSTRRDLDAYIRNFHG